MTGERSDYINNICNIYNNEQLNLIDISDKSSWTLPQKTAADIQSRIQYGDRIPHNISRCTSEQYNTQYLKKIFTKIDNALSDRVPLCVAKDRNGIAFPNGEYNISMNFHQLWNKESCLNFVNEVCNFDDEEQNGKDALKIYYLLGYVGSGKTTLLNHIALNKSSFFKQNNIISIFFEYDEISGRIYDDKLDQDDWNEHILEILIDKILANVHEIKRPCLKSIDNKNSAIDLILKNHNVFIVLDGFDSLTANKIERKNAQLILYAIKKSLSFFFKVYKKKHFVTKTCNVIFSLRKCTYDTLKSNQKIGRIDTNNAYFLHPPDFVDVITNIIKIIKRDNDSFQENMDIISTIIQSASSTINKKFRFSNNFSDDVFDNNIRRRLRYISSVIIVYALRLSNIYKVDSRSKKEDIHKNYLTELKKSIEDSDKDYLFNDILVYGVNTCFNNHFSKSADEDNLGKLCGFVDNIFCYFGDAIIDLPGNQKMIIKLRVLQLLENSTDEGEQQYLSKEDILSKLTVIGFTISSEHLEHILDFLEKSLFVRSHFPIDKKIIHFKCSNFGKLLINKILHDYTYISAICQNSCLPNKVSRHIKYKNKSLSGPTTNMFINKEWVKTIIPYMVLFIRVLKSVELTNKLDKCYHMHSIIIDECNETISTILNSKKSKLETNDLKIVSDKCDEFNLLLWSS